MWAIYWQTFHFTKGVLWDQERKEKDVAQEKKKDGALQKNDKNRAGGKIKKMAGKQQRDYWGDMSRRGDVRYTVSCGDKDDQLLTPLHFNCQNKKLVQASWAFLLRRRASHRQKHETCISWEGCDKGSLMYHMQSMYEYCKRATPSLKFNIICFEKKTKTKGGRPSLNNPSQF